MSEWLNELTIIEGCLIWIALIVTFGFWSLTIKQDRIIDYLGSINGNTNPDRDN